MPLPTPPATLSAAEAQTLIRNVVGTGGGRVEYKNHLFQRQELRGITPRDIERALANGVVSHGPTWSGQYENWEMRLTLDVDEAAVRIGVSLEEEMFGIRSQTLLKVNTTW